jgi:hypothetical protein
MMSDDTGAQATAAGAVVQVCLAWGYACQGIACRYDGLALSPLPN